MARLSKKLEEEEKVAGFSPSKEEEKIQQYLRKRIPVLKKTKKDILDGIDFEEIMRSADREYQPRTLTGKDTQGRYVFSQDEVLGLRGSRVSRTAAKEGASWRSDISEPTLMVKIQTALSILVDRNPEAVFKAINENYKKTTVLAQALWKRSWNKGRARHQMKLFVFDLAKYGWAIGRTYPRMVVREGNILTSIDSSNPENNKYKKARIVEYNDVYREKLDPYRTWIDDMTNLQDPWSMDDWYFEKDYSHDAFKREFGQYTNAVSVKSAQSYSLESDQEEKKNQQTKERRDIVTVGFYESKNKDLYTIWIPGQDIPVYYSPLPNDQKKLSCWQTYWVERDPRTPYGIGLYEILKNNKVLFDQLENMTIDQLLMAIYPMLFYSGSNQPKGSGDMVVSPGLIKQKMPGTTIEQVNVNFDPRGFDGIQYLTERIDENTGVTPTLQGEVQGKTLGEVLHAKDAALKRLSIPLSNIAQVIEEEAYIALSWMNQIYSIPEALKFVTLEELEGYEKETGKLASSTSQGLDGTFVSNFMPLLDLGLEEDRNGTLIESPNDRFFQVGEDILPEQIKWEGIITVHPQSILAPSQEIERQRKLELYNVVIPVVTQMAQAVMIGAVDLVLGLYLPLKQILESQDENPKNWIPRKILKIADNPEAFEQEMKMQQQTETPLFMNSADMEGQSGAPTQNQPRANTLVNQTDITNPLRRSVNSVTSQQNRFGR